MATPRVDVTLRGAQSVTVHPSGIARAASIGVPTVHTTSGGTFAGTRFGIRFQDPDTNAGMYPYVDLDPYRGLSTTNGLNFVDSEYAAYAGVPSPLFQITTEYSRPISGSVLSSFSTTMLNKFGAHCLTVQPGDWTAYANPTSATLNSIQAMCDACPTGKPIYILFVNEPDRNTSTTNTPAVYRSAFARFALEVKNRRGSKLLYPGTAYTKLSFVDQNNNPVSGNTQWNCAPEMEALGLDPATDAVMAHHGYSQNPADPTDYWGNMMTPVYNIMRGWGFDRFAFSEGATKNRTTAQFNATSAWFDNMANATQTNKLEFFVYYYSGGSGGIASPEGWWIAGSPYNNGSFVEDNRNKIKYAQIARDFGV